jgi:hypothetical protein
MVLIAGEFSCDFRNESMMGETSEVGEDDLVEEINAREANILACDLFIVPDLM